jgi:flap endonuclease-1
MVAEAQELLDALGLPWVTAPSEGEAQAAAMMAAGVVDAAVSQDFDTLLFGAPRLLRNLTVSGRRKLPGRQAWVEVNPEELTLADAIEATQLSHEQLVDMAILMGTDFNPGIHGIGPKKGLKLLRELGSAEAALAKLGHKVDNLNELRQLFLNHPSVEFVPTWGEPRRGRVMELLCERHGFSRARVGTALEKFLQPPLPMGQQATLGDF